MHKYLDKATIFVLCTVFYIQFSSGAYIAVPVIGAVIAGAFLSYVEQDGIKLAVLLLFGAVACYVPALSFFLPVLLYDMLYTRYQYAAFTAVIPVVLGFERLNSMPTAVIVIALFSALSLLMRRRTVLLEKLRKEYISLRDSAKELSLQLERNNKELMDKQDYEVHLATLNERNRIARDIHDNVGHILSNAILQTGALLATTADEAEKERLRTLKDTLTAGMDSIRSSIHDLHEESVDLYTEFRRLVDGFNFCRIALDYDVDGNPDKLFKYALIAVVKEALSNIIRHSDATQVTVAMREHPAIYQLIVRDNGSKKDGSGDGIGLKNIRQRVESLGGIVNITSDGGFTVFVSIPKEIMK
jgi:signal transduction histidine kinase